MQPHVQVDALRFNASAGMFQTRFRLVATVLITLSSVMHGQEPVAVTPSSAGHTWANVKALPPNTKLHVTTDHGGKSCRIFAVTDDTLTCARGGAAGDVLQRAEIKHIKLTHYVRSTLVGAGVGGGIGAIAGAIAGRTKPCPTAQTFCLNGIGIGAGGVALIFGVGAGVVGSVAGGATDFARGSSIYTRP